MAALRSLTYRVCSRAVGIQPLAALAGGWRYRPSGAPAAVEAGDGRFWRCLRSSGALRPPTWVRLNDCGHYCRAPFDTGGSRSPGRPRGSSTSSTPGTNCRAAPSRITRCWGSSPVMTPVCCWIEPTIASSSTSRFCCGRDEQFQLHCGDRPRRGLLVTNLAFLVRFPNDVLVLHVHSTAQAQRVSVPRKRYDRRSAGNKQCQPRCDAHHVREWTAMLTTGLLGGAPCWPTCAGPESVSASSAA